MCWAYDQAITRLLRSSELYMRRITENTLRVNYKESSFILYRGADKSLARPGRKQTTTTEDFESHISYL